MNLTRRDYFFTFTALGLALCAMMWLSSYGATVYYVADYVLAEQGAGISRWLSRLFRSDWTSTLVQYIFIYGVPYLSAYCIMHRLPKVKGEKRTLSLEDFLVCLVIASGIGYILNIGANVINGFFSMFNGKSINEMNPAIDAISTYTPSMVIYVCLLGPFMEEVMFRGLLLRRARRFGDRTAVVFCAVAFGLMHGNLPQFFYATFVGLIFGYIAVKTNRLCYNVLLHITFNSYTMITTSWLMYLEEHGRTVLASLYSLALYAEIGLFVIGACYLLWEYGRNAYMQMTIANGAPSPYKKYVYLNPGFILYFLICGLEIMMWLL